MNSVNRLFQYAFLSFLDRHDEQRSKKERKRKKELISPDKKN